MSEIIKLFDIPREIIRDNEFQRRVYSTEGISPTLCARSDSAKIVVKINDETNSINRWNAKTPIN